MGRVLNQKTGNGFLLYPTWLLVHFSILNLSISIFSSVRGRYLFLKRAFVGRNELICVENIEAVSRITVFIHLLLCMQTDPATPSSHPPSVNPRGYSPVLGKSFKKLLQLLHLDKECMYYANVQHITWQQLNKQQYCGLPGSRCMRKV